MTVKLKMLFLDDRSKRIHDALKEYTKFDVTVVPNVLECLRAMAKEDYHIISLDIDLGGMDFVDPESPFSGMAVVHYLEKTGWPPEKVKPRIIIHSSNIFAATDMERRFKKLGFRVKRTPFYYGTKV